MESVRLIGKCCLLLEVFSTSRLRGSDEPLSSLRFSDKNLLHSLQLSPPLWHWENARCIFPSPHRLIADEGIPHIAIIPEKVIRTSSQSAGAVRGVFTTTEGRGKLEKNPTGFFEMRRRSTKRFPLGESLRIGTVPSVNMRFVFC